MFCATCTLGVEVLGLNSTCTVLWVVQVLGVDGIYYPLIHCWIASICSQVAEVEDVVNEKINNSLPVYAFVAPLEQASKTTGFSLVSSSL